ncbi:MAG: hypothetical protein WD003_00790 [Candidatus Paceibacterota bacterium]
MDDIIPPHSERNSNEPQRKRRIPKPTSAKAGRPRTRVGKVKRTMFGGIVPDMEKKKLSRGSFRALWGVAILTVIILLLSIATIFEHATLEITPKQRTVDLDFVFTAVKESTDPEKIPFEIITIPLSDSITVDATEIKQVQWRASGTIIIYNNYESVNRRLVKNTRFETSEGLIYRVYDSIIVPALKIENGERIPGSLEVTVYADEPGEKYNSTLTDFTIPGFKNDPPRFEGFYARSKTEMTGGYSGEVKTVSDEKRQSVQEELRSTMRAKLLESVGTQKPEGFALFNDGIFITFTKDNIQAEEIDSNKKEVTLEEEAVLRGILFNEKALSQKLGEKIIQPMEEDATVMISNMEELSFNLLNKDSLDLEEDTTISFSLSGRPHFVWQFDDTKLIRSLFGRPKGDLRNILSEFKGIAQAEVVIRPFWKRSFPEKESRFTIKKIITN